MKHELDLAKGKWFWLKDIDLDIVYIWVNCSIQLWKELLGQDVPLKLFVDDVELKCYMWDSTQNIRSWSEWNVLLHLTVHMPRQRVGALLVGKLTLELNN